jgi:hypothetical protein
MLQSFDNSSGHYAAFSELPTQRYVGDRYYLGVRCANLEHQTHRYFLQTNGDGHAVARVVAIVANSKWHGQRVGMLGLYEAIEGASPQHINQLLGSACEFLKQAGCQIAIGPVNGSTWFDYRFCVPGGGTPYFLDVYNPAEYLGQWLHAGFAPVEHYQTCAIERDRFGFSRIARFSRRMANQGVELESVGPQNFLSALPQIHELCLEAFVDNPLFAPIEFNQFLDLYQPVGNLIDPDWALMATDGSGRLLGFALAFPDLFDDERRSLVIKTVAVRNDRAARGLGAWMTEVLHRRAHAKGMDRIYHALMHEHNPSTRVHGKSARVYKQYVLLGRPL